MVALTIIITPGVRTNSSYLTLHKKNSTGKNTATAIVMGINQLSSDA